MASNKQLISNYGTSRQLKEQINRAEFTGLHSGSRIDRAQAAVKSFFSVERSQACRAQATIRQFVAQQQGHVNITKEEIRELAVSECEALWGTDSSSQVEYYGSHGTLNTATGTILAALFYVMLRCDSTSRVCAWELELKCRLPPGHHLNAVVRALVDNNLQLHYSWPNSDFQTAMADWPAWRCLTSSSTITFSKTFQVEPPLLDTEMRFMIESPFSRNPEEISNSPCCLMDLLDEQDDPDQKCNGSTPASIVTSVEASPRDTIGGGAAQIDKQLDELEKMLVQSKQWK